MRVSDEELMIRCRNGDMSAFELLVSRYQNAIINFIYRSIGDYHRAEDLSQETFLRVFKSASRYEPKAQFKNWLYKIAVNLCKNEIRDRQRHGLSSLEDFMTDEEGKINYAVLRDFSQMPDVLYEKKEQQILIRQAIDSLPENQRLAIIMVTYQNLRYDEIANTLGCSVSAVKSLIHRARQNLKNLLLEMGIGGSYNAQV
ncbi:sigma-70 family RNA polymerase sigma factor [Candidatus Poribacteria bacterium]|nr:sigma-70 family RNA polymerase sigma factor [Candidatus Poribacteria bacterium]